MAKLFGKNIFIQDRNTRNWLTRIFYVKLLFEVAIKDKLSYQLGNLYLRQKKFVLYKVQEYQNTNFHQRFFKLERGVVPEHKI